MEDDIDIYADLPSLTSDKNVRIIIDNIKYS